VQILIYILVIFVALEHLGFLVLEMFMWTRSIGQKVFGMNAEKAEMTKILAANQGLYNGIIAAGLLWGLVHPEPEIGNQLLLFFLSSVVIAGIFGGFTVKRSIFVIQGLPAAIAGVLVGSVMI
jgi:putative membrane protein